MSDILLNFLARVIRNLYATETAGGKIQGSERRSAQVTQVFMTFPKYFIYIHTTGRHSVKNAYTNA